MWLRSHRALSAATNSIKIESRSCCQTVTSGQLRIANSERSTLRFFSTTRACAEEGSKWKKLSVPDAPHVKAFLTPDSKSDKSYILSLLDSNPPNTDLSLGTSAAFPPTPSSFKPNPKFMPLLHDTIRTNAADDPAVKSEGAKVPAGSMGPTVGTAASTTKRGGRPKARKGSAAASSSDPPRAGGWIHIADERKTVEWARTPDGDDIIASVEVDGSGNVAIEKNGKGYQENNMYRIITRDGMIRLSPYMEQKLIERLRQLERDGQGA